MDSDFSALCRVLADRGETLKVFISAGEPSGDSFGARIMAEVAAQAHPCRVEFAGVGGPEMRKQGLRVVVPMEDLRVMGLAELLPHLHRLWGCLRTASAAAVAFRPHAVVTVDYKGFNLRLQARIRAECAPIAPSSVHIVAPSAWAWRGGQRRLAGLWGVIDDTLCILPFEPPILEAAGLRASFIGHPVLDELAWDPQSSAWEVPTTAAVAAGREAALATVAAAAAQARRGAATVAEGDEKSDSITRRSGGGTGPSGRHSPHPGPIVCVLPGSRPQETQRLLPLFGETLGLLSEDARFRGLAAVVPTLPSLLPAVAAAASRWTVPAAALDATDPQFRYGVFSACDAALACSGTVTAQLAAARLPAVVSYRTSAVTEWIARRLALVPFVSLPNLVLGREAVAEEVFAAATPERLATRLGALLGDERLRSQQREACREFIARVSPAAGGGGGAARSRRASGAVVAAAAAKRILSAVCRRRAAVRQ